MRHASPDQATIRIRITCGEDIAIGQGKADLLQGILEAGSISGGARKLGMSYRKAWLLVDEMNRCFKAPLVEARLGGARGGGAVVTALGLEALNRYRELQTQAWDAVRKPFREFERLLGPAPAQDAAPKRVLE